VAGAAGAAGAAAVAAVAASDKDKSTNIKGHEYPLLFFITVMDGNLYPGVIMMLQTIDVHNKQHRN
jgi:hypothetical protein